MARECNLGFVKYLASQTFVARNLTMGFVRQLARILNMGFVSCVASRLIIGFHNLFGSHLAYGTRFYYGFAIIDWVSCLLWLRKE